jgi:uncharacterized delta-60 repeat protein
VAVRRTIAAICVGVAGLALVPGSASAAMGDLDVGFSGDGKLIHDLTPERHSTALAVDAQNRVIVAGDSANDLRIVRYLPDGRLDDSFATSGVFTKNVSGTQLGMDAAEAVAVDQQGRIVAAGQEISGSDYSSVVVRLTPAGSLDPTFGGGDGIAIHDLSAAEDDLLSGLAIDAAGRPVATGRIGDLPASDAVIMRLTAAGELDSGFGGGDGFEELNVNSVPSQDHAQGIAIDSAGRAVIAGYTSIAVNEQNFFAARFTPSGLLDLSFSNDLPTAGRTIEFLSSEAGPDVTDRAEAVAIAPGDRPVLAGIAETTGAGNEVALLRLTSAGVRDTSFGAGDGKAYAGLGASSEEALGLAIDSAGRAVTAGVRDPGTPAGAFLVARFLATGALDTSFGGDGMTTTDVAPGVDQAREVALDHAGRIVAAGANGPTIASIDWAVARYEGVPRCAGRVPTVAGTPGKDKLKGTKRKDVIWAGPGKDTIKGLAGADRLCGDAGKDRLIGGKGNDRLIGGAGNDVLSGGPGKRDRLKGGKGRDRERQ